MTTEAPASPAEQLPAFVLDPSTDLTGSISRRRPEYARKEYVDREFKGTPEEYKQKTEASSTVYVGNISCFTNEYQLFELFSRCGSIKRIIMGLDKFKKTPCGFAFVEFCERESALRSITNLSKSSLDNRQIKVNIDHGFEDGRQFGRGKDGGQISDERQKRQLQAGGPSSMMNYGMPTMLAISFLILLACSLTSPSGNLLADAHIIIKPAGNFPISRATPLIRNIQRTENRREFETAFARLLVNIMKSAKPTLMQAFMRATLEDSKLKEIAIGIFFNSTDTSKR